jgi:hypothetical protein
MEESEANMNEGLEAVISKWFDGLEWGSKEPEQLDLFSSKRGPTDFSPRKSQEL